jgi:dolichyl-phosphate-mannose--protein O-mannosyl transferase
LGLPPLFLNSTLLATIAVLKKVRYALCPMPYARRNILLRKAIERFNTLVFDEVYYAKFAKDYLTKTPFFNPHPPLSQYIIAIGI